jgi:hypothetical protein
MPIPEDEIPVDSTGRPDLRYYTRSADYYYELYKAWWSVYLSETRQSRREGRPPTEAERATHTWWSRRVHGTWGLIAKGSAAVPFAMEMLRSKNPDFREDAVGVLAAAGGDDAVIDELLNVLERETDQKAVDSTVMALGELRNRKAIPALARLLLDPGTDGDTANLAAHSLGQVVRQKFGRGADPIAAAREWLASHPTSLT